MAGKKHKKDPDDWLIKRRRDGRKHIDACATGYVGAGPRYMQVHHLLPVTSLADGTIADQLKNDAPKITIVTNCLMVTDWDINAEPNVIALPRKTAYIRKRAPGGWDKLPCHEVDHPYYTKEVCDDLRSQVWEPVCRSAKACEFEAADLIGALEDASDTWRGKVEKRGKRNGGTKVCWDNRAKESYADKWYAPFSMAANPTPRSGPPETFSGNMQEYLKKVFAAVSS
jgi:hypothetical protein